MEEKPVLHLMVNNTCTNDRPLCCNKQYDVEEIPIVSVEDLKNVDTICFTGGQPIANLCGFVMLCNNIAKYYPNIKNGYIYLNGGETKYYTKHDIECLRQLPKACYLRSIKWGLTMSPKCDNDWDGLKELKEAIDEFDSNRIYCFSESDAEKARELFSDTRGVDIVMRKWQKNFVSAPNTIFRRLPIWIF